MAFPYIYPREYAWLISTMKEKYAARANYAEKLRPIIETELKIITSPSSARTHAPNVTRVYTKIAALRHGHRTRL